MKKNMGSSDRIIRSLLAFVIAILFLTNVVSGTFGIVLLVVAIIFAATSFMSFCPLYSLFGLSTCKVKENN